jgi:thiamine transporter ThiT
MATDLSPMTKRTNWLLFWLRIYIGAFALSMVSDIWTHFSFTLMAGARNPGDAVTLIMRDAAAVDVEDTEARSATVSAEDDEPADDFEDGEVGLSMWDTIDSTVTATIPLVLLGLYLLTGLLFLGWVYRITANLRLVHGKQFAYTPIWSVVSYFVPFINIAVPPRIMQKIWATVSGSNAKSLVPGWWGLVVLQWVTSEIDGRLFMAAARQGAAAEYLFSTSSLLVDLGSNLLGALVALYTLLLIRQVTREYHRHLEQGTAETAG